MGIKLQQESKREVRVLLPPLPLWPVFETHLGITLHTPPLLMEAWKTGLLQRKTVFTKSVAMEKKEGRKGDCSILKEK